jgi:hypothetical protein
MLSITKMQKRGAYWRLIDIASLSMSSSARIKVVPAKVSSYKKAHIIIIRAFLFKALWLVNVNQTLCL